ncbi:hypothetical protein GCM10010869_66860 [Mesorhizobium tianshanense]|nr:hypothetical protein GCM10010869_66860 [Mesorhizobium tianshanense]
MAAALRMLCDLLCSLDIYFLHFAFKKPSEPALKDLTGSIRHSPDAVSLTMIFPENRFPLFGIMV